MFENLIQNILSDIDDARGATRLCESAGKFISRYRSLTILALLLIVTSISVYGQYYYDTSIPNKYVEQNAFLKKQPDTSAVPSFSSVKTLLPDLHWPANPEAVKCYWRIWELEFSYLRAVTKENRFVSHFIEPPFNQHIFMWDASFMTMFGRYGHRAFNYMGSLDNFYAKQHKDGYISREISIVDGSEQFEKFNVVSTGPNIMPWAEWEHYLNFGDKARLQEVFPVLVAYYQWYRTHRTWPDGSYFSSGWGCGMDNQPRLPAGQGFDPRFSNGFMSWIDINLQQILVGKILVEMASILHRQSDVVDIQTEIEALTMYVQKNMWDEQSAFFYDRFRDGSLNYVKSIAAFWSLIAGVVPTEDAKRFISHLENPAEFARTHRVATLSADAPGFDPHGGYWNGAIWAPTNYMVLKGLTKYGNDSLAHEIALNHVNNVVEVFSRTGTFWENYAPDFIAGTAMKDFVDWDGLIPINDMFEYVFGIRPNVQENTLMIDVRLTDEFGINRYPFGKSGVLNILCKKRKRKTDKPSISIQSNLPIEVIVKWSGGSLEKQISAGKTNI
jgi:hypothetical protein